MTTRALPSWLGGAVAAALSLALALALVPAVVNGDGLGYLKAAPTGVLYPGHLGYLPLLRALGSLVGREGSLPLLLPARALSLASLALCVLALHDAGRQLAGARAAFAAALGIGVSFGALQSGSDVETYAPALAAMCLATAFAARRHRGGGAGWTLAAAFAVAAAALLHVENVLFAPAAALLCARRPGSRAVRFSDAAALLALSGGLVAAAYLAAFRARSDDAASAIHWVAHASHGFSYPLRPSTPLVALYGMAKTLVYAPYPYQASWPRVIGETLAGVAGLAALALLGRSDGASPPPLPRVVTLAWALPYAVVGVAFFASDNERWLFLLPPAWLLAAAPLERTPSRRRLAAALIAGLAACDLALGLPLARDATLRDRAAAASSLLRTGDLVISPGHSWDEYLGFYEDRSLDRYPMIYFCGLLGGEAPMRDELAHRVAAARARGARVYLARMDEGALSDGWKELALFDLAPRTIGRVLPPGRRVVVGPGLERLDE